MCFCVYMYCSLQDGHTALITVACIEELLKHGAKVDHVDKVSAVLQSIIVCLACSLV